MSAPIPAPPPDASLTLRGLINTASQSVAGVKTFRDGIVVDSPTLIFDTTNHRIGIGADPNSLSVGTPSRLYIRGPFLADPGIPTNAANVYVMSEITSTLGNNFYGGFFNSEFNPQAPSSANVRSLMAALTVKNNQAMSGFLYAAQNQLDIDATMSTTVADASAHFAIAQTKAGVTGTVTQLTGVRARVDSQGAGSTVTKAFAVLAQNGAVAGTVSNKAGVVIEEQTGGGHNTNLLIGTNTVPTTGDYALYSASSRLSSFGDPSGITGSTPTTLAVIGQKPASSVTYSGTINALFQTEFTTNSGQAFLWAAHSQHNPSGASSATARAIFGQATTAPGNAQDMSGATIYGVEGVAGPNHGSSTLGTAIGVWGYVQSTGGASTTTNAWAVRAKVDNTVAATTLTNAFAVLAQNGATTGTVTNKAGVVIEEQTGATHNTNLLIGTATVPTTGDYALYSASARTSAIAGPLQYQDGTAQPTAGGLGILQFGVTSCVDAQFLPPGLGAALASAVTVPVPFAGTCRAMYVVANTTGSASYRFTIVKNGADANSAVLAVGGGGAVVSGSPTLFTVTAGDRIAVRMNNIGGVGNPANVTVTLSFGVGT